MALPNSLTGLTNTLSPPIGIHSHSIGSRSRPSEASDRHDQVPYGACKAKRFRRIAILKEEFVFKPVQPVRAYQRVVEQVEEAVMRGDLKAGSRLSSERELMKSFKVSRSTVREALRVLESNGLLRSRPGDPNGAELLPLGSDVLRGPLTRLANFGQVSLLELLQFRILLEGATSYLAAALRTDEQLTEMQEALQSLIAAMENGHEAWGKADVAFHDAIARASGNSLLQVCSDVVRTVALNMIENTIEDAQVSKDLLGEWVLVHTRMFEAIRNGDAELAGRQARLDLYDGYAGYLAANEREMLRQWVHDDTVVPAPKHGEH
jgi:GntR family transcriptional repressor for pyruvate dehydrogenase complex